mmetsp:Transcript_14747/g.42232  ORF Transcript_14747/g.42232 Transcript_14747/m.42232 type:complete len:258 (-) Transcript_14747:292-1065(-)
MFTTVPRPRLLMAGRQRCMVRIGPKKFVSKTSRACASETISRVPTTRTPALFTRTSTSPSFDSTSEKAASTDASSQTSMRETCTVFGGICCVAKAASRPSRLSGLRRQATTRKPISGRASAATRAAPSPDEAPVTMQVAVPEASFRFFAAPSPPDGARAGSSVSGSRAKRRMWSDARGKSPRSRAGSPSSKSSNSKAGKGVHPTRLWPLPLRGAAANHVPAVTVYCRSCPGARPRVVTRQSPSAAASNSYISAGPPS